ncbi:MAG: hypothetical protein ACOYMN_14010 [Roseimicrobium sp.]
MQNDLAKSSEKPPKLNGHYDGWYPHMLLKMANDDSEATVRRELASLLIGTPRHLYWWKGLALALLKHGEDKDDPMIPLLLWYGIEPLVGADAAVGLELAKASKMPKVTEFIYRRMGAEEAGRTGLLTLAAETKDVAQREALLNTVILSARAGNKIAMPENWAELRKLLVVRPSGRQDAEEERAKARTTNSITELEAFMGAAETKQVFRTRLMDTSLSREQRDPAFALLLNVRDAETAPLLVKLIRSDDKALTRRAVQGLATLPHPDTASLLMEKFPSFDATTQIDAVNTLATNAAGAKALLTAVKAKTVPATMLSPFLARQIDALKDAEVAALLKEVFGDLNAPKADLEQRKQKFRATLTPAVLAKADAAKGRLIYNAICGQCHKLFGEGQNVGPDLTGSNRANLDYLLDNVLDPNAVIGKDYQLNLFELKDGRVASGVIKEESPAAYRIAMPGGLEQIIAAAEVKLRTVAKVSTMPAGLFDALPQEPLAELVAYLQSNASPPQATTQGAPIYKVDGALEGEALQAAVTGGSAKMQNMTRFTAGRWSGGQHLWWTGAKPGATLTLTLPVAKAGKFALKAALTQARDYGVIEVALDGKTIVPSFDGFHGPAVIHTGELDWGQHELTAGAHRLTLKLTGAHPDAVKSYMVGLDYVKLVKSEE